ncbi:hypothetical protein [Promicromonospora iranensis]|uniref:Uncharacterized protein n=1 Tax=Promicromonospora iranensis TaxID=1105144 RepID=A0ABU2CLK4_9MICO|nr:hypothetical protein [Promicromonospora iranensis]MDR7382223.1 hypothetical protein [Promicromonospora iranensis]
MVALLNVFRAEVLIGLWLIRILARLFVRSWRNASPDPKHPFPWALSAQDRREAYENMMGLSYFGMSVLGVGGGLVFGVSARALGFPTILEFLGYLAVAAPCTVTLIAYFVVRHRLARIKDRSDGHESVGVAWEVDIENNPRVLIGASLSGLAASAILAFLLLIILPDPSTWVQSG